MLRSITSAVLVASSIAGFVSAQSNSGYSWNTTDYPYALNQTAYAVVSSSDKQMWCTAQTNTCNQICDYFIEANSCIIDSMGVVEWNCTCSGFATPNITMYSQTILANECITYRANCVNATVNNAGGAASRACAQIPCPSADAAVAQSSVSASMAAATASSMSTTSASVTVQTTGGSSTTSTSTHNAAATPHVDLLGAGAAAGLIGLLGLAI